MSYAVLAKHRGGEREVEICRVDSEAVARSIAQQKAKEKFREKLSDMTRAKGVHRYLSVRVQEVAS